jgi:hypothetical protein
MKTLDIKVTITNDGKLLVNSPVDIPMGEYNAVIVLEDRSIEHQYCSVNENFHVNNLLYKTKKSLKMLGFVPQPNLRIFVF